MQKEWSKKILSEKQFVYYLRHTPSNERNCYFFILVNPIKEKEFIKAIEGEKTFDLKNYGEIIDSGYGDEAPKQVIEWIKRWYDK